VWAHDVSNLITFNVWWYSYCVSWGPINITNITYTSWTVFVERLSVNYRVNRNFQTKTDNSRKFDTIIKCAVLSQKIVYDFKSSSNRIPMILEHLKRAIFSRVRGSHRKLFVNAIISSSYLRSIVKHKLRKLLCGYNFRAW